MAQMAEAQRAMREREAKMKRQEEELKDVQRVREAEAKAAQARHRRFLLWAGAGLVAKSRDLVAAAAEAACHVLLLPGNCRVRCRVFFHRLARQNVSSCRRPSFTLFRGVLAAPRCRVGTISSAGGTVAFALLAAKDLERQMDIKRRNLSSFAESREANDRSRAGSRTGTPRQSRVSAALTATRQQHCRRSVPAGRCVSTLFGSPKSAPKHSSFA